MPSGWTTFIAAVAAYGALALFQPANPWLVLMVLMVLMVTYLGYFAGCEGLWARTPGKVLFDLRVRRLDGTDAGFAEAVSRTLLRLIEANPLLAGGLPAGLAVSFSKRRQRLGDRLAGTVVVRGSVAPPETVAKEFD